MSQIELLPISALSELGVPGPVLGRIAVLHGVDVNGELYVPASFVREIQAGQTYLDRKVVWERILGLPPSRPQGPIRIPQPLPVDPPGGAWLAAGWKWEGGPVLPAPALLLELFTDQEPLPHLEAGLLELSGVVIGPPPQALLLSLPEAIAPCLPTRLGHLKLSLKREGPLAPWQWRGAWPPPRPEELPEPSPLDLALLGRLEPPPSPEAFLAGWGAFVRRARGAGRAARTALLIPLPLFLEPVLQIALLKRAGRPWAGARDAVLETAREAGREAAVEALLRWALG